MKNEVKRYVPATGAGAAAAGGGAAFFDPKSGTGVEVLMRNRCRKKTIVNHILISVSVCITID